MPDVAIDTTSSDIVTNIVTTLEQTRVAGASLFNSVRVVDDVESFLRVSDALAGADKPEIGVVEGTIEERNGDNDTERIIVHLPFEIIVRFAFVREPASGEKPAMDKARQMLEACKTALLADKSRGGKARLIQWGADIINGTTFRGTIRQLVSRSVPNQAFFAASLVGACAWSKL